MKKFKTSVVCALAALLCFSSCSNSSDSSGVAAATLSDDIWALTPVANGIQVSVSPLPVQYYGHSVFIKDAKTETRGTLSWDNKAAAWTGVYPLVTAGNSYTFILFINKDNDTHSFSKTVTATGGLGELSYSTDSWSVTLSKKTKSDADGDGIQVFDYDLEDHNSLTDSSVLLCIDRSGFSLTDSNITPVGIITYIFNGNGYDGTTWDGEWIGPYTYNNGFSGFFILLKEAWTEKFFGSITFFV